MHDERLALLVVSVVLDHPLNGIVFSPCAHKNGRGSLPARPQLLRAGRDFRRCQLIARDKRTFRTDRALLRIAGLGQFLHERLAQECHGPIVRVETQNHACAHMPMQDDLVRPVLRDVHIRRGKNRRVELVRL